ncbi:MAG: hypothetical protein A3I26_03085 [Candidatus Yanofskybacteria bacterium RIFCSPLOWO2_02_FULL_43_10]|nr:MAG: hypothetical protein A3C69_03875 [Candidatus Yanofskybacteria bacterium RIFCSPHIGHO2_02_FULL_43_12]OGN29110.1 MAG: hypothetical protein A3I26_03085 [Candidatus Yanofskybacteria bacterium RIFCSPLOWO2_02_FULL_43_10]
MITVAGFSVSVWPYRGAGNINSPSNNAKNLTGFIQTFLKEQPQLILYYKNKTLAMLSIKNFMLQFRSDKID